MAIFTPHSLPLQTAFHSRRKHYCCISWQIEWIVRDTRESKKPPSSLFGGRGLNMPRGTTTIRRSAHACDLLQFRQRFKSTDETAAR